MNIKDFIAGPNLVLSKVSTEPTEEKDKDQLEKNLKKIADLQEKLYADSKYGVVILIQAMDTAGKDGIISHVMTALNPQGTVVSSFKQPSSTELKHDYLWRASNKLPERGQIGIFNRSYYEEVLVVKVHDLIHNENIPENLITGSVWEDRYTQINNYEKYLSQNGFVVIKLFLNISKDAQKERLLARIDDKSKNWKFSESDLKERQYWDDYMNAYESLLRNTSTTHSPWYIVPSNQKWFSRLLVSEILLENLKALNLSFPQLDAKHTEALEVCKQKLLEE